MVCSFVLITGISPASVLKDGVKEELRKLKEFLKKHFRENCIIIHLTNHAVTFLFHGVLKVDLLPSPYWRDEKTFHEFLCSIPESHRPRYHLRIISMLYISVVLNVNHPQILMLSCKMGEKIFSKGSLSR